MVTVTYDPAIEHDVAPPAAGVYFPAYEIDSAPDALGTSFYEPALEIDTAPPAFRRGGPVPELIVMCGFGFKQIPGAAKPDGSYDTVLKELIPTYAGIPVTGELLYGFTVNLKMLHLAPTQVGLMWFKSPGGVADQIAHVESDPWTPPNSEWHTYTVQGFPPEVPVGAFLIPYIRVVNTFADIPFGMAGAQVYAQGGAGTVTAFAPDRYITLGDTSEKLGQDFLLGNPAEKK